MGRTNSRTTLDKRRMSFVSALCAGMTLKESAAALGVTDRTARRWYVEPLVQAAIREAQSTALADVMRRMNAGSRAALDVLDEVMRDKSQPPAVRIRAAQIWLDTAFKARELCDIEARLEELEEKINERQK